MNLRAAAGQVTQDLRFGLRNLRGSPGYAAAVIASLALGIAATTAMFSVIHGVILDPFPYAHPETLLSVVVREPNYSFTPYTPEHYLDIAENSRALEQVLASTISDVILTGTPDPERLRGNFVTTNTFETMGVAPLIGRAIVPADGAPDAPPVAVLGYRFWQRRFAGDPSVIGTTLRLNDRLRTVVGVMPPRFMWRGADVYLPIVLQRGRIVEGVRYVNVMGRLKDGLTKAQAEADLQPVIADILTRDPYYSRQPFRVQVRDFYETYPSSIRQELWILLGAVAVLLLIACANASSLMLARAAARARELAVRGSLGAGQWRIARQLLAESALTGAASGVLGIFLAYLMLFAVKAIIPPNTIPDESEVSLNRSVLAFSLGVSMLTALVAGVAPAFHAARIDLAAALKGGGRGLAGHLREGRVRKALVALEVSLAMLLLIAASLVVRTLLKLQDLDLNYEPETVLSLRLPLPESRYPDIDARVRILSAIADRIGSLPGVERVAFNHFVHPFANWGMQIIVPGSSAQPSQPAILSQIDANYPALLGLPVRQGRLFTVQEVDLKRQVVLVNEALVRTYFDDGQAVGRLIRLPDLKGGAIGLADDTFTIVGVVGDTRNVGLTEETYAEVYVPYTVTGISEAFIQPLLLIASRVPAASLANAVRSGIHELDPDQPVMQVRTVETLLVEQGFATPRFGAFLFSVFAGLGVMLAGIGVYGVVSYSVSRQMPALGIRMALGATRAKLFGLVLGEAARLTVGGIAVGGLIGMAATRSLSSLVYGVSPLDPFSFGAATLVVFTAGVFACVVPAWRASCADPMSVLRHE